MYPSVPPMPLPVICPACGKSFSISEEIYQLKIHGRVVSIRCRQCKTPIRIDGTKRRHSSAPNDLPPDTEAGAGKTSDSPSQSEAERPQPKDSPPKTPSGSEPPSSSDGWTDPSAETSTSAAAADSAAAEARPEIQSQPKRPLAVEPKGSVSRPKGGSRTSISTAPKAVSRSAEQVAALPQRGLGSVRRTAKDTAAGGAEAKIPGVLGRFSRGEAEKAKAPSPAAPNPRRPAVVPPRAATPRRGTPIVEGPGPSSSETGVDVLAKPPEAETTVRSRVEQNPPVPGSEPDPPTFLVDSRNGDRELTAEMIGRELKLGSVSPDTLVWREGMDEWLEIKQLPELAALLEQAARSPSPDEGAEQTTEAQPGGSEASKVKPGEASAWPGLPRLRPKQPTLLMGAPPASAFGVLREPPNGGPPEVPQPDGAAPKRSSRTAVTRKDLLAVRSTPSAPGGGPTLPRRIATPIPSDDDPTVLRSPEAVAELLKAGDTDKEALTPVPAHLAGGRRTSLRSGETEKIPSPGDPLVGARSPTERGTPFGLDEPVASLRRTQQLGSLIDLPKREPTATRAARKPSIDTVRESPEAKRAWFPEDDPSNVPAPPPMPPPPVNHPLPAHAEPPGPAAQERAPVLPPVSHTGALPFPFAPAPSHAPGVPAALHSAPRFGSQTGAGPFLESPPALPSQLTSSPLSALRPSMAPVPLFQGDSAFQRSNQQGKRAIWVALAVVLVAGTILGFALTGSSDGSAPPQTDPKHR